MRRNLRDMCAIITGASSGIGHALAHALAERGARLALAARRGHRLDELVRQLPARSGHEHLAIPTDVADESQCRRLVDRALNSMGRIDTLVCNAGFGLIKPLWQTGNDELSDLFRTNVLGATACIRRAVPHMLAQEPRDGVAGQVVIVSSVIARRGLPLLGAYGATKAAQLALAESLRVELRGTGVTVTTVHPALTRTEFFRTAMRRGGTRPNRRAGAQPPERVAKHIVDAIERPRPEVWPAPRYRWVMSLATIAPRLADLIVSLQHRNDALARPRETGVEAQVEPDGSGAVP